MMHTLKKSILLLFLSCIINPTYALWPFNRCNDVVARNICSCDPLECGRFDVQFQGGVAPIRWSQGEEIKAGSFTFPAPTPVLRFFNSHPILMIFFMCLGRLAGKLGMHGRTLRTFLDFNYVQAAGK